MAEGGGRREKLANRCCCKGGQKKMGEGYGQWWELTRPRGSLGLRL